MLPTPDGRPRWTFAFALVVSTSSVGCYSRSPSAVPPVDHHAVALCEYQRSTERACTPSSLSFGPYDALPNRRRRDHFDLLLRVGTSTAPEIRLRHAVPLEPLPWWQRLAQQLGPVDSASRVVDGAAVEAEWARLNAEVESLQAAMREPVAQRWARATDATTLVATALDGSEPGRLRLEPMVSGGFTQSEPPRAEISPEGTFRALDDAGH